MKMPRVSTKGPLSLTENFKIGKSVQWQYIHCVQVCKLLCYHIIIEIVQPKQSSAGQDLRRVFT